MPEPFFKIQRFAYADPDELHLNVSASNGSFGGAVDVYCNVEDLRLIGTGLEGFPVRVGDEFVHEFGFNSHLRLRAYTVGKRGECALQISMDVNGIEPGEGTCRFSIPAEAAALNRLGRLFGRLTQLRHLELQWTPAFESGQLFEEHQP